MAKIVLHLENLNEVDAKPLLGQLGADIVVDAKRIVAVRTGRTRDSIRITELTEEHVIIQADPRNPDASEGNEAYAGHLERGTSDTPAQPFMRPATYRYRS